MIYNPMTMHFATVWEHIARAVPDQIAIAHGPVQRTWSDYEDRAARIATALTDAGLGHNSKVAILLHNSNEYLEVQFGTMKMRACPVNVNYRYLASELLYLLDNADAEAVFFQACYADRIHQIRDQLPQVKLLVQIDDGTGEPFAGVEDYETLIAGNAPMAPVERADDDLYMLYTGGTTGMPKGVMYNNGEMCRFLMAGYGIRGLPVPETPAEVAAAVRQLHEQRLAPRSLVACPLMHGTGMWIGGMTPHNLGGTVCTIPNLKFDPDVLWDTVESVRATDLTIVGDAFARPMLRALENAEMMGRPWDISSLKLIVSSGVMWTAETKQGLLRFGDMTLFDAMGSTEGSMGSSVTTRDSLNRTAGFAMNETTRVFTEDGRLVTPGSGEIGMIAAGGNVPVGYYKDPEKSARTFRTIDGQRYSFPGDYARVEADGSITLLGRGSMCINTAGEKVFPEEVEESIKRIPGIEDALVVGVPDERFGERVWAVVALHPNEQVTEDQIQSHCRSELAGYKLPRGIVMVPQVRRAANGKPDYQWARDTALAAL
ncbi:MAG: acyl-CoA synthetase [Pseudomonadales bacterium]|nr:acyl-CoA synthetase [Pseudomonadales bacterium]